LTADPFVVALRVAEALEACGVRYLVGGSLASSASGEPRSTLDIDLVVALTRPAVEPFIAELRGEFYADSSVIREAVERRSSANIIHLATALKIDLFVMGGTPLDEEQMTRRRKVRVASDPERFLYFYAPEDILLQKLRWYRLGNETSDRQWRDILGIIRTQAGSLDTETLNRGAKILGVDELLGVALRQGRAG